MKNAYLSEKKDKFDDKKLFIIVMSTNLSEKKWANLMIKNYYYSDVN